MFYPISKVLFRGAMIGACLPLTMSPAAAYPSFNSGIIDCKGKEIVSCDHKAIRYLGNGLYFSRDLNRNRKLDDLEGQVIDADGKPVPIRLPDGTVLINLFILDDSSSSKFLNQTNSKLPRYCAIQVKGPQGIGLCATDGRMLISPQFKTIYPALFNTFEAKRNSNHKISLDTKTGRRCPDTQNEQWLITGPCKSDRVPFRDKTPKLSLYGYLDGKGRVAIAPQFLGATAFDTTGTACVRSKKNDGQTIAFLIDKSGSRIPSPEFASMEPFNDGVSIVSEHTNDTNTKFGIVNRGFSYLLKPEWLQLKYLVRNMYMARKDLGSPLLAISETGTELFSFPENTIDVRESEGLLLCLIEPDPKQAEFINVKHHKTIVLLNSKGERIFFAPNCELVAFSHGLAVIAPDKSVSPTEKLCTIVGKSGILASGIRAWQLKPVDDSRLIKTVIDQRFQRQLWDRDANCRTEQFGYFLRDHDLMGMPKSRVVELLGGNGESYSNYQGMCGSFSSTIEIRYGQGKVTGWRWAQNSFGNYSAEPWITEDVLLEYNPMPELGAKRTIKIVPKAQQMP